MIDAKEGVSTLKILPFILFAIGWISFIVFDYYANNKFISPVIFILILAIFVLSVIFIIRMLLKKDSFERGRYKMSVVLFLVVLISIYSFEKSFIEKTDWLINYHSRMKVVEKVKTGLYRPNILAAKNLYGNECRLPFRFPILSISHNVIRISRNKDQNTCSVYFHICDENYVNSPYFVYTEDETLQTSFDDMIENYPEKNWKIRDNWYRILIEQ
jgi:hypothetical protein